eukprot:scaffold856_cov326-Pavlova_lutheri.AAC.29
MMHPSRRNIYTQRSGRPGFAPDDWLRLPRSPREIPGSLRRSIEVLPISPKAIGPSFPPSDPCSFLLVAARPPAPRSFLVLSLPCFVSTHGPRRRSGLVPSSLPTGPFPLPNRFASLRTRIPAQIRSRSETSPWPRASVRGFPGENREDDACVERVAKADGRGTPGRRENRGRKEEFRTRRTASEHDAWPRLRGSGPATSRHGCRTCSRAHPKP